MDFKSMLSQKNMGQGDKNLRMALGAMLLALGLIKGSAILLVIASVLLITSARGNCPAYSLLGFSTKKKS